MDLVAQVRKKLESEGMFTQAAIQGILDGLRKKKAKTNLFQIDTRRELTETIAALDHLLERIWPKKQPAPDN